MVPQRRLARLVHELQPSPTAIGTLKLRDITYEVTESLTPSRLPSITGWKSSGNELNTRGTYLLDARDPVNLDNLHFLLQKFLLGQDVFLVGQPGAPYARRLALTFASLLNLEYEYIALHRDVGETELKQGREIREGGNLVYVDSPAVNAAKHGRLLILEGIERAERGIMPVLNNLLENREMNLEDGTQIIHPHRHALLDHSHNGKFIPAHRNFRVIAIAAPVPPYPGYPLDPPFRSRFQSRFVDPIGALIALADSIPSTPGPASFADKLQTMIITTQLSSEARSAIEVVSKSSLPPFPQTALLKLRSLCKLFPPPETLTPSQLGRIMLTIHPALAYAPFQAWALLSRQMEENGLGELGSPSMTSNDEPVGLFGYTLESIKRETQNTALLTFKAPSGLNPVTLSVSCGPNPFLSYPINPSDLHGVQLTPRFLGLLTCFVQAHALGWDISYIPSAVPSTASSSTSTLVKVFGKILGYEMEVVHMYKEMGGRDLVMRRKILEGGATTWEPSSIVEAAWRGKLVHLASLDVIGPTIGALTRFIQDRELELWGNKRIVSEASAEEVVSGALSVIHPSFRIITTASKSLPLKDWLSDEQCNSFFPVQSIPMDHTEESSILISSGCRPDIIDTLLSFAEKYRRNTSDDNVQKNRKLGTRSLLRIAKRLSKFPDDARDLHALLSRCLLAEFLPATERMSLEALFEDAGIRKLEPPFYPPPVMEGSSLVFPPTTSATDVANSEPTIIPFFDPTKDADGVASLVPYMDHFYDNSQQTGLMRDVAIDMELLGEHLVLLGNQGVGKNKIMDRLCQLLRRPREYVQLHRDTTVNQLMFTTILENGVIHYSDSPLLRAIKYGRVILVDEADKAPEHVVAIFRSLAGQSEMTLSDGRRVVPPSESGRKRENDIVVHPEFRLVLLANRPGYPFLGNHFMQVLGENFSAYSVSNPDILSERKLLQQLAPEMDEDFTLRLVGVFHDLRAEYDNGTLSYPYSLRELINLIRHLRAYPTDSLGDALRNVFDFDIYKPETIDKLSQILDHHGLSVPFLGLDAAREVTKKPSISDLEYTPKNTDLSGPKEGVHDNKEHQGGNTYAGGTGGRDTAGVGGRGGYKRFYKGGDVKQIPENLKEKVPEEIQEKAREMARQELKRRLEELDISATQAKGYGDLLNATQAHMLSLHNLLEHLAAKEEERVWVKRQTDGELDDSRLTEGITGEATVYKRRGMEKPEIGRPQVKPKRIRFIFDLSTDSNTTGGFNEAWRQVSTLEHAQSHDSPVPTFVPAVMLMETFDRLSRKDKYVWDMCGHSGDEAVIPLVTANEPPKELKDRWKVVEKMYMIPQYAFAGDYTVEAIQKGVEEVGRFDGDDWFVIAITDANFGRYQITPQDITRAMKRNPKVHSALICIGEGADAPWITQSLPGKGFRVRNTGDIPTVLRSILSTMVDR
uniref:ATPase dynein-related AAA domain-containing protein n=1 Tax=Moniliophthora roreri TaxID=221103 RepID=A0A0W0GBJ0_MONRR